MGLILKQSFLIKRYLGPDEYMAYPQNVHDYAVKLLAPDAALYIRGRLQAAAIGAFGGIPTNWINSESWPTDDAFDLLVCACDGMRSTDPHRTEHWEFESVWHEMNHYTTGQSCS